MTIQELFAAAARRWYAVAAVILVTAGLGLFFGRDGGFYATRTVVAFQVPGSGLWEEEGSRERGVIAFALAIANQLDDGAGGVKYAAVDAPYYGAGITEGVRVSLPDSGGQWEASYTRAAISVDIVDPDRGRVAAQQTEMLRDIRTAVESYQAGIPRDSRIVTSVDPLSTTIEHISPPRIGRVLGYAALGGVAVLGGCWAAVMWDRRAHAWGRTRRGSPARGDGGT